MRSRISNVLWGLFFILIGIGFAGNAFNLWNFTLFFAGWWTMFIIIPCVISIIQNGFNTGNSVGLAIGLMLFLTRQGILNADLLGKLIVPVILIIIGLSILFANVFRTKIPEHLYKNREKKNDGFQDGNYDGHAHADYSYTTGGYETAGYTATFSAQNINMDNQVFNGTNLNAIFGSVCLRLENAIINEDVVIDCNATFGGIEIHLPDYVKVKIRSTPLFGGVSNRTRTCTADNAPTVYINATCMFGGVEIR